MIGRFLHDRSGAAAAELALILPLSILLVFATLESGHFIWSEHKVVEAVRNGARFAARQPMSAVCPSQTGTVVSDVQTVTRTGVLGGTIPVVPGWSNNNQVTVTYNCATFLNTGIYTTLGGNGATVTVSAANLNYPSLFGTLGVFDASLRLNASSSTAVIGL